MAPHKQTTTIVSNNNFNKQQQQQQAKPRKRKASNTTKQQVSSIGEEEQKPQAQLQPAKKLEQKQPVANSREQSLPTEAIVKEVVKKSPGKQLSSEENIDEIDAGIELDGSSNSGSSVKDMGEDGLKSASASPVMGADVGKQASNASAKKNTVSKREQLAANAERVDADEQLLQQKQKLQKDKVQKKPSLTIDVGEVNKSLASNEKTLEKGPPAANKRRFSSQSSTESANGSATPESQSICKVCNQHVYQMERMLAEKSVYHKRCFRCFQCKIQLRVDSYSSHEGQVYCKTHHKQLFQPQVKLDNDDDVDIVAKSTSQTVDDYLLQRGRLSELSFSFLQPKVAAEGARQRQMIICENEPKELPSDVVRSDTKLDDGIDQLNLNLGNILQKFERGQANANEDGQSPSSTTPVVIEKPSINIKQTLRAFESRLSEEAVEQASLGERERPVVRKLTNINGMFLANKRNSEEEAEESLASAPRGPLPMKRSESLMLRLKKYESRIAGEQVEDDDERDEADEGLAEEEAEQRKSARPEVPKRINLSSLKSQWEKGDTKSGEARQQPSRPAASAAALEIAALRRQHKIESSATGDISDEEDSSAPNNQSLLEKEEELGRIRRELALKKVGGDSVRNIYENAIKEAQEQSNQTINNKRRDSNDLSALNGTIKTTEIQQQLLKQVKTSYVNNDHHQINRSIDLIEQQEANNKTPTTPTNHPKGSVSLSKNRANKLKERFELGLINNSSRDDSDPDSDDGGQEQISNLEQIRRDKMEDLSVFTDGEIKAREARSLFQQIDRRISAAAAAAGSGPKTPTTPPTASSRSLASIGASMRAKLTNQMNGVASSNSNQEPTSPNTTSNTTTNSTPEQQPIRLTNNVIKT